MTLPIRLAGMKKGDKVVALSRGNIRFTARVETIHRNGDVTVEFQWVRGPDDQDVAGCYDGARYRIPPASIERVLA